jgi:hypothetical protein
MNRKRKTTKKTTKSSRPSSRPDAFILPGPPMQLTRVNFQQQSAMFTALTSYFHGGEPVTSSAARLFAQEILDVLGIGLTAEGEREAAAHVEKMRGFARTRAQSL